MRHRILLNWLLSLVLALPGALWVGAVEASPLIFKTRDRLLPKKGKRVRSRGKTKKLKAQPLSKRKKVKFKAFSVSGLNALRRGKKGVGSRGKKPKTLKATDMIKLPRAKGARGKAKQIKVSEYLRQLNQLEKKLNSWGHSLHSGKSVDVVLSRSQVNEKTLKSQEKTLKAFRKPKPLIIDRVPGFIKARKKGSRGRTNKTKIPKTARLLGSTPMYKIGKPKRGARGGKSYKLGKTMSKSWKYGDQSLVAIETKAESLLEGDASGVKATGTVTAAAWLFGQKKNLANIVAEFEGKNRANGGKGTVSGRLTLTIDGKEKISPRWTSPGVHAKATKPFKDQFSYKYSFSVGPIPMSIELGLTYQAKFSANGRLEPNTVSAEFLATVESDAFARYALLDFQVASGGVDCTLKPLDAEISIWADVGLGADDQQLYVWGYGSGTLAVDALSGTLGAWVKVGVPDTILNFKYRHEFFKWKGVQAKVRLFDLVQPKKLIDGNVNAVGSLGARPAERVEVSGPPLEADPKSKGTWSPWQKCPLGQFAWGFQQDVMKKTAGKDQQGVTALRLVCSSRGKRLAPGKMDHLKPKGAKISSKKVQKSKWQVCGEGSFLTGFKGRIDRKSARRDKGGVNDLEFSCSKGDKKTLTAANGRFSGDWAGGQTCGVGYILAVRTKTERSGRDKQGLSGVEIQCGVPHKTKEATAKLLAKGIEKPGQSEMQKKLVKRWQKAPGLYRSLSSTYDRVKGEHKKAQKILKTLKAIGRGLDKLGSGLSDLFAGKNYISIERSLPGKVLYDGFEQIVFMEALPKFSVKLGCRKSGYRAHLLGPTRLKDKLNQELQGEGGALITKDFKPRKKSPAVQTATVHGRPHDTNFEAFRGVLIKKTKQRCKRLYRKDKKERDRLWKKTRAHFLAAIEECERASKKLNKLKKLKGMQKVKAKIEVATTKARKDASCRVHDPEPVFVEVDYPFVIPGSCKRTHGLGHKKYLPMWVRTKKKIKFKVDCGISPHLGPLPIMGSKKSDAAVWLKEKVKGKYFRLKNKKSKQYLTMKGGTLQIGKMEPKWHSAMWRLEPVDGQFSRLRNRWVPNEALNIERGIVEGGYVRPTWTSAQWKWEKAGKGYRLKSRWKKIYLRVP
jgi:hypothetical protein